MTDVKAIIRTEDGALVTAANPFPVTGVVTATDLDLRTLTATMDSIAIQGGNTADVKVTLDGEQVSLAESYEGGTAVGGTPPKGVVSMMIKGGAIVPVNDTGNDLPVSSKAEPGVIGPITIASGQSLSGEIDLNGATMMLIDMPAAFDGTALTFQVARATGGTFKDLDDDVRNAVSVGVTANRMVAVDISALKIGPARYLKIRAGTSASPSVQAADRELYLITK